MWKLWKMRRYDSKAHFFKREHVAFGWNGVGPELWSIFLLFVIFVVFVFTFFFSFYDIELLDLIPVPHPAGFTCIGFNLPLGMEGHCCLIFCLIFTELQNLFLTVVSERAVHPYQQGGRRRKEEARAGEAGERAGGKWCLFHLVEKHSLFLLLVCM